MPVSLHLINRAVYGSGYLLRPRTFYFLLEYPMCLHFNLGFYDLYPNAERLDQFIRNFDSVYFIKWDKFMPFTSPMLCFITGF